MSQLTWNVVHADGMKVKGSNNSGIDRFKDNKILSLAREVTQNSLDAHLKSATDPTKLVYEIFNVTTDSIPGIQKIKKEILPEAEKFWKSKNDEATINFLKTFREKIEGKEISILKISDFNTKGLNKQNYESLVLGESYSVKDSEDSAGSKGIGKAAPFVCSDLRMVFYSSLSKDGEEKSAGVMNFVSYLYQSGMNGTEYTQDSISFYDNREKIINKQTTFGNKQRSLNEYGTDLFIIGIDNEKNLQKKIILATMNNFLMSIYNGNLTVEVFGEQISKSNLPSLIKKLSVWAKERKNDEWERTLSFYKVLTDNQSIHFNLDERFDKYDFIKSSQDASLILLQHESATRTVLQTRKAGMKIAEKNRIDGSINFSGIFQATGMELNKFLKEMESADHDKWSADRLPGNDKKIAKRFLQDLLHFYKDLVKQNFDDYSNEDVEAFGIKNLLPMNASNDEATKGNTESGIQNHFSGDFSIKETKDSSAVLDGSYEEDSIARSLELAGIGDGDTSGSGSKRTGNTGGDNPDNNFGFGSDTGTKGPDDSAEKILSERKRLIDVSRNIKMKLIERDFKNGEYRLSMRPGKNISTVEVEIRYIGADGKSYSTRVENANSLTHPTSVVNGKIIVENLKNNVPLVVDYQIDSQLRMKVESIVNEIKG